MRAFYVPFTSVGIGFGVLLLLSQLVSNSRFLARSGVALREWSTSLPLPPTEEAARLIAETKVRAALYDDMIQRDHLLDGMLVNRTIDRHGFSHLDDQCDSLLFSSLRFVGLSKLGFEDRAKAAWRGIEESRFQDQWIRHPRCRLSPSRDMLLGVLIALSQRPEGFIYHLRLLIDRVRANDGYFADGPLYLSYMTPGVAKLLRLVALSSAVDEHELPDVIREGHSTSEWTFYGLKPGYQAHLIALSTWLELELQNKLKDQMLVDQPRPSLVGFLPRLIQPLTGADISQQSLDWNASELVELDPENLFFRFLRLQAAGALTPAARLQLLRDLLAMSQFPSDRLPSNCDRRADYVWQRDWRETRSSSKTCNQLYNGADFLWMAGLILEPTTDRK